MKSSLKPMPAPDRDSPMRVGRKEPVRGVDSFVHHLAKLLRLQRIMVTSELKI